MVKSFSGFEDAFTGPGGSRGCRGFGRSLLVGFRALGALGS